MFSKKIFLFLNLAVFGFVVLLTMSVFLSGFIHASEAEVAVVNSDSNANAWAFMAAALATGIGSIGAGIAVAAAAPAAIGALAENENNFGKAMIFVGLGEGLAIFGLLVSILILQKVP